MLDTYAVVENFRTFAQGQFFRFCVRTASALDGSSPRGKDALLMPAGSLDVVRTFQFKMIDRVAL